MAVYHIPNHLHGAPYKPGRYSARCPHCKVESLWVTIQMAPTKKEAKEIQQELDEFTQSVGADTVSTLITNMG
jgi:hypothetical protein